MAGKKLSDEERRARRAFRNQRTRSKARAIDFAFTFAEWWAWWETAGWQRRGRGRDKLVMARLGDCGGYAPGNVYVATFGDNARFSRPQLTLDLD